MANADVVKLLAVLELKDLFSDKISRAERNLNKFESRSTKAGRQIGLGILRGAAVAASGVTAFGAVFAKGLSAASDLNETVSKTGVVFGKNAKQVLAFGHNSAEAMGLSQNAALSAAATYGNLFVSLGLTTSKAATMSTTMVKLASDLASFNDATPEEALQAIQSGLVGETEPLRRFGINLNDATLRQEALSLGLVKTTKTVLPPAVKAQAAYALILKQSGTAQGDFARTSGGLANQLRTLKGNVTDTLVALAAPALPGVAKIFQNLNKEIKANQPAIAALGEKIGGLFTDANIKTGFNAIKEGFQIAKEAAPAIADAAKITGSALKIAVDAFKSLPKEVQQIAIAGLAVNKLTGGLVTNIAGGIIDTVGKSFLQRGGTPANPLFVSDVTGGIGKGLGGAAGAAGGGGLLATALPVAVIAASIVGPIVAGKIISDRNSGLAAGVGESIKSEISGGASLADLQKSLDAVTMGIGDISSNPLNVLVSGDALDQLRAQRALLQEQIAQKSKEINAGITPGGFDSRLATRNIVVGGFDARIATALDSTGRKVGSGIAAVQKLLFAGNGKLDVLGAEFKQGFANLKTATGPAQIKAAVAAVVGAITKGRGNAGNTGEVLNQLKRQLKNTHDPVLARILRSAIGKVESKLPGRQFAARELALADQTLRSSKTSAQKIEALKTIERQLKDHGLPQAASRIREKIDAAKRATVAAEHGVKAAVDKKKLSVTTNVTVPVAVTMRSIINGMQLVSQYGHTAVARGSQRVIG